MPSTWLYIACSDLTIVAIFAWNIHAETKTNYKLNWFYILDRGMVILFYVSRVITCQKNTATIISLLITLSI